jgi:hypothetical protein
VVANLELLLAAAVDLEARNDLGETPLLDHSRGMGCKKRDAAFIDGMAQYSSSIRVLAAATDTASELNAVDNHGRSALHLLASPLEAFGTTFEASLSEWECGNS